MNTVHADDRHEETVKDLPFGMALYEFYQQQPLSAITVLEASKQKGSLTHQAEDAELLLGGLYFSYGLPHDAENIFNNLLENKASTSTQDRIWFNLARVQYESGNYAQAADLLSRIQGKLSPLREAQKYYFLSTLYIREQQVEKAAEAIKKIPAKSIWRQYSQYNLGVSLLSQQQNDLGKKWLNAYSFPKQATEEQLALIDSTHLALGIHALKTEQVDEAIQQLSNIRLSGPLSNKALLATGWSLLKQSQPDKAIAYWSALKQKNQIDGATQESILAIPHAVEQKGDKSSAIHYYQQAAENYDRILLDMDQVIESIEQDELIQALLAKHLLRDNLTKTSSTAELDASSRSSHYLYTLLASKPFHQSVKQYQQMLAIRTQLESWQDNLPVFQLMLSERKKSFESKRPLVEQTTSFDQLQAIQKQRDELAQAVYQIEQQEDYLALANEDETDYLEQLEDIKTILERYSGQQDFSEEKKKYRLLSGLLQWQISTDYPARFWQIKQELIWLDRALEQASVSADSLSQAAQLHELRLGDFDDRIQGQQENIEQQLLKVSRLLESQQNTINQLAINEIRAQQQHVVQLRLSTRYSLSRLYDDLSRAQPASAVTP